MKKWIAVIVVLLFAVSMGLDAGAVLQSTSIIPSLSFSGTTANCKVIIAASGKNINATLQLWHGNTLIKTWSGSGSSRLVISGTCKVTSGQSYTLKVVGSINGTAFASTPITRTCP